MASTSSSVAIHWIPALPIMLTTCCATASLSRPHARGRLAEGVGVVTYAAVDLFDRVQRVAEALRQFNVGNGLRGQIGVEEQRQDGVVEGRGGDLDAALVLQAFVQRDHLGHQPGVLGQHGGLVLFAEVAALGDQIGQRLLGQPVGVGPGQVEQHLQIQPGLRIPRVAVGAVVGDLLVARESGR